MSGTTREFCGIILSQPSNHKYIQQGFFSGFERVTLTKETPFLFCYPFVARQNIFVNTALDHTALKTETTSRLETAVNSPGFTRTNRDSVSCDKKIKLDSLQFFLKAAGGFCLQSPNFLSIF